MTRYICIHGHFYQPPRENPCLEEIELQESAYTYHDWNERITSECYAPNAASRILDEENRITDIINNYAKISFDFGPTLLSWMERQRPNVYQAILEADRLSMEEGMWLPEAAVDIETLEVLVNLGIKFTVIAQRQAKRTSKTGEPSKWQDVSGEKIDPTMAYRCMLPSGRNINIFFSDGPISKEISFGGLLDNGESFYKKLVSAFNDRRNWDQLVNIITDGETFGHHHRFGDMGLAYCLHLIETNKFAKLTNYAEYLEDHPPTQVVEVYENSSWSCIHGIERWKDDCGCNSGGHPTWTQAWRKPLRNALDMLRDKLSYLYSNESSRYFKDPWNARNGYINIILDRSGKNVEAFLEEH
ncbi:MAG: DUF3536 domain-containing protein, partial [Deltaproteobacteria bacterium]|nr:DUF3536 domain-containing protein [Deltaproteobacteria bacterium]